MGFLRKARFFQWPRGRGKPSYRLERPFGAPIRPTFWGLKPPMSTVRYGILGTGMMGREHIRNIALIDGAEVVALADPDEGSREAAAMLTGRHLPCYADWREMIDRGGLDAVVVATPNYTHIDQLRVLLETDLAVMVEKPLATTVADAKEAEALAAKRKAVTWVAMEYRYMPPFAHALNAVHAGFVGTPRMVAIREHRFPFLAKVGNWNRINRNTGGTMVEKCCHFFDLMRLITGSEAVRVYGSGGQDVNHKGETYAGQPSDILDNAFVIVDFANGARAHLDLCMFAEGSRDHNTIAISGDVGKVECCVPSGDVYFGTRDPKAVRVETIAIAPELLAAGDHYGSTYYEHLAFLRAVKDNGPVEVTMTDGRKAVEIGAAAERSIAEGTIVHLDG